MQVNGTPIEILHVSLHPLMLSYSFWLSAKPLFSGSNPDAASIISSSPPVALRSDDYVETAFSFDVFVWETSAHTCYRQEVIAFNLNKLPG
jgi:hypothetical protein